MTEESLQAIAEQITKMAAEKGIDPDEVVVSIVWVDRDAIEYGIRIAIETDEGSVSATDGDTRGPVVARCRECTESELVTLCVEGMLEALSVYEDSKQEPEPPPADEQPPVEEPVRDTTPTPTRDQGRKIGPLGWAGVAGIAVGVSGVVAGGVLIGLDTRRLDDDPTKLRHFRPPGYAVLGAGAGVLVTGVVLVAVDVVRHKRKRTAFSPVLAPDFAGASARFRF